MGKLLPLPRQNESMQDYRKRLVEMRNNNPLVKMGLIKKRDKRNPSLIAINLLINPCHEVHQIYKT